MWLSVVWERCRRKTIICMGPTLKMFPFLVILQYLELGGGSENKLHSQQQP